MNNNEINNERWKDLFSQLPEEKPSELFRSHMMEKIRREAACAHRRNERMAWAAVSFASVVLIVIAVATFIFMKTPKITIDFPSFALLRFSTLPLYLFIGAIALFLLILDNQIRKNYRKRHSS
jgi:hypothetical protein